MPLKQWETDQEAILSRLGTRSKLKLCVKTLDEPLLIESWISHHARIVGMENLIIADNSSTDPHTLAVYKKYAEQLLVFKFQGPHNQIHWHPKFFRLFEQIKNTCEYFSFIDADERLVLLEPDRWVADTSIVDRLDSRQHAGIIPTTWLINKLNSFDTFLVSTPNAEPLLENNLKWGKPIYPSNLVGIQPGIHNTQFDRFDFTSSLGTHLFLLHLTQFPERRISVNRNKLISRGVIDEKVSSEALMQMDFSQHKDNSFLPLVTEMRTMYDLLSKGITHIANDISDYLTLEPDGAITYSSENSRQSLCTYIRNGNEIIASVLQLNEADSQHIGDADSLLAYAIQLRDSAAHSRAERLLRRGMALYPTLPSQYGGPAFRKELMRLLLSQGEWAKAEQLAPTGSEHGGATWHRILFARALSQRGQPELAENWWRLVHENEPNNGEASDYLRQARTGNASQAPSPLQVIAELTDDLSSLDDTVIKSRTKIHDFMDRFFKVNSRVDADTALAAFRQMIQRAKFNLTQQFDSQNTDSDRNRIPLLIHRIWLTNPSSPAEPPTGYIDNIIQEANTYHKAGWDHFFWIQDTALLPNCISRLQKEAPTIKVLIIDSELEPGAWQPVYFSFLSDRKFPFAADILRMKILLDFGGIYADMGARFDSEATARVITDRFEYTFIFWETMFFQNSLMGMPKASKVARLFMRLVETPYSIPIDLFQPLTGLSEGMLFSGLMLTAILLSIYDKEMRVLPLAPNLKSVRWSSQQSWYTNSGNNIGKHGNAYIPATGASFFDLDEAARHQTSIDTIFL